MKCYRCSKPGTHQTAINIDNKLMYVPICDECQQLLNSESQKTSALDQFSKDLTKAAEQGKLDPVIGRESEILRLIHILSRRRKNNPVLLGEPGVGKTAIVEGLAQRIVDEEVPEPLQNKRLVQLDLAAVVAGAVHRGTFEKRLKSIIHDISESKGQILVFIDEIHTLVGTGTSNGSMDASNILKPYLARGEIHLIGATTLKEYRLIEKDSALERRFQKIIVNEPSDESTFEILDGLRPCYEDHHKIKITEDALHSALKLSKRYVSNKFLPDKAVDLIDEAGAGLKLDVVTNEPDNLKQVINEINQLRREINNIKDTLELNDKKRKLEKLQSVKKELSELWMKSRSENIPVLTEFHIAKVIADSTGIPVNELTESDKIKLKELQSNLSKSIIDQDQALESVVTSMKRTRVGIADANRPNGVFMFLGPTGVGKTETAKVLAKELYGSEDYLIRVDMSEFGHSHNISRLIGAPPGYVGYNEGGQLTEKVKQKPFSIILLDEIEKAHPDVFNALLQVFEDGMLTDGNGVTIDFRNTTIVMTSNIGSSHINTNMIGYGETSLESEEEKAYQNIKSRVKKALKDTFRPEFINRIDEVVIFKPLSLQAVKNILNIQIEKLRKSLQEIDINIEFTDAAKDYFANNGYNIELGARPLRRLLQKEVDNNISNMIIDDLVKNGDTVLVDLINDEVEIKVKEMVRVK